MSKNWQKSKKKKIEIDLILDAISPTDFRLDTKLQLNNAHLAT